LIDSIFRRRCRTAWLPELDRDPKFECFGNNDFNRGRDVARAHGFAG
jgi:hypothetical protein